MNQLQNNIKNIIIKTLEIKNKKINNTTHLYKELNLDSLDIIEIYMAIEEEFQLEIPEEISENFKNIEDIANYINKIKKYEKK
ncbi:Acyl carrier protein [Buchnera aphidicola (Pterocallis alni)]|uniref:acyl carrier protein n=1 Tax=Buchnera aphidicola TaxID=9 RepID=UPI0034642BBE